MTKKLGIYIHIPFCKTICTYCNFLVFANKSAWIEKYIETIIQEISIKSSQFKDYIVDTLYFGGGTPSLIRPELIFQVISSLKSNFQVIDKAEISIECNPESLDEKRLTIYKKAGINRISLGVQSLNNQTLKKVARPHNSEKTLAALKLLKNFGWENFSCDIIMGLPYQNLEDFQKELATILSYKPTHLSSYFLSYDTSRIDTFIKDSPTEETQVQMYWHLIKTLKKDGYKHYEVSNYSRSGYACQHNQRYWQQEEYLGLGIGAHSYYNQKVNENTRDFSKYLENPELINEEFSLDPETSRMDFIMLSLRTKKGLNIDLYKEKYHSEELTKLIKKAHPFLMNGQLKQTKKKLYLTDKGMLFADQIYKALI